MAAEKKGSKTSLTFVRVYPDGSRYPVTRLTDDPKGEVESAKLAGARVGVRIENISTSGGS